MIQHQIELLPLSHIRPNPDQPRKFFPKDALEELAGSIRSNGLLQPIAVVPRFGWHMIIAGERRYRACKLAPLDPVPCIVKDVDDSTVQELALIENINRADLSVLEEARAYQGFLDNGYTVEALAKVLGFSQPHRVTERTNLLRLDPVMQERLQCGALSPSQAYEMSRLSTNGQRKLWQLICDGKCVDYNKLRRAAQAIYDSEHQVLMFREKSELGEDEKRSLSKVDAFLSRAGSLLDLITNDDLSVLESVHRSDAGTCIAQLDLVIKTCGTIKKAMQTIEAKQEAA